MSDEAQRVLDALIGYDADEGCGYPILSIIEFFDDEHIELIDEDIEKNYQALTAEEEKQVIKAFLDFAY